ncbi:MAG: cysteine desulfurase [Christensenellaceae bacterium]|jgi:cysteine desulfurase|nr:cysteine desulfurase [Christensenellaceae bacterium]
MIYLDNSATTKPFPSVAEKIAACLSEDYFNPSALYAGGMRAKALVQEARGAILAALPGANRLVFTSGGTEADNLAIFGVAQALRGRRGSFIASAIEHPAVLSAMERLKAAGHEVFFAPVDESGVVKPNALADLVNENTALVSIMQVNNETGAIQPIAALSRAIKAKNPRALLHVDGVQGFLRCPIDLGRDGVDLYSLSAHKIHGPKGVGALALAGRPNLLPALYGGGQEEGLRSGTENVPGIAGLGEAVRAYSRLPSPGEALLKMKLRLAEGILSSVEGAAVNGPRPDEGAPHILNIGFPLRGEVLLHALEGEGILVSTGSACSNIKKTASQVLKAMALPSWRIEGAIRFSLSPQNTMNEIEETIAAAQRLSTQYRRFVRR